MKRIRVLPLPLTALATLLAVIGRPALAQPNPERNAYFGETHIHTSWSLDAWVMGNRITGPDDAYKYAQGKQVIFMTQDQVNLVEKLTRLYAKMVGFK